MIHNLVESVMMMKMDIYRQFEVQNPDSGAIKREWHYSKTIPCHAKGVISNSATSRSSDRQQFGNTYMNEQMVQVRTLDRLYINQKITNIVDSNNEVIWKEINYPTETPTVFEVVGVTPMMDSLGRVIGYSSNIKRSENQVIGL